MTVRSAVECYVGKDLPHTIGVFPKDSDLAPIKGDVLSLAIDNETHGGLVERVRNWVADQWPYWAPELRDSKVRSLLAVLGVKP